jgi:hypothetical protein
VIKRQFLDLIFIAERGSKNIDCCILDPFLKVPISKLMRSAYSRIEALLMSRSGHEHRRLLQTSLQLRPRTISCLHKHRLMIVSVRTSEFCGVIGSGKKKNPAGPTEVASAG